MWCVAFKTPALERARVVDTRLLTSMFVVRTLVNVDTLCHVLHQVTAWAFAGKTAQRVGAFRFLKIVALIVWCWQKRVLHGSVISRALKTTTKLFNYVTSSATFLYISGASKAFFKVSIRTKTTTSKTTTEFHKYTTANQKQKRKLRHFVVIFKH